MDSWGTGLWSTVGATAHQGGYEDMAKDTAMGRSRKHDNVQRFRRFYPHSRSGDFLECFHE
jgi:hypothetical protein